MTDSLNKPEPSFRRRRPSFWIPFVRFVVWLLCLAWTAFIAYLNTFFLSMPRGEQHSEDFIQLLVYLVAGYVIASGFDRATRCWEPWGKG